jgi:hypothetical protein
MKKRGVLVARKTEISIITAVVVSLLVLFIPSLFAQKAEMQQRIEELKASSEKNKQALAQYTWQEDVKISLKGEQKKEERFLVRMGPDGKPQKTPIDSPAAAPDQSSGRGGRLKARIVENKKEEFQEYGQRMKELTQQYIPPNKDGIQDAYAKGNISITPDEGAPSQVKIVIQNYVKPQDSMTLIFDKDKKQLVSIKIASYLDGPDDAVKVDVQFSQLPDGPNHVSGTTVEGVSKQLTVVTHNSDYHKQ